MSDRRQLYFNVYSGAVFAPSMGGRDAEDCDEIPGQRLGLRSGADDAPTSAEISGLKSGAPLPKSSFPPDSVSAERRAHVPPFRLPPSVSLKSPQSAETGVSASPVPGDSHSLFNSIESNRNSREVPKVAPRDASHCGTMTLVGVSHARTATGRQLCFRRLACKCWDCPRCGKRKAKRYRRAIIANAERLKLRRFLTLTLDPSRVVGQPIAYLRGCWAKLRTYFRRRFGPGMQFISVLEFQKNGSPHLHVLVDRFIEWKWLQTIWQALGGGLFVNIKFVDIQRVSAYLSKYLTKDLLLSAPKGSRRITSSRGIVLLEPPESLHTWCIYRLPIVALFSRYSSVAQNVGLEPDVGLVTFTVEVT